MQTVRNIYAEVLLLIAFFVPFCFITYQLIDNTINGTIEFIDILVLTFDLFLAASIYLQISTIRLYMWSIRKKSHDMTGN
jgi:hypothetical protein